MNYVNHNKFNLQHFMFFNIFFIYLFAYMEMSKDSPAKHYQNNIKRLQKKKKKRKLMENFKVFLKKKRKKKKILKDTKIYQKRKNKSWLVECKRIIIK